MKNRFAWVLFFGLSVFGAGGASAGLKAVTTTSDLADLVRQVGGDRVSVESLSSGSQNPHFVEAKPSLILKLMSADVFVQTGLDLETGWAPLLLKGSRNAKIQPGARGHVDAAAFIDPLDVPTQVSRAEGDVHPGGNPHYLMDPENARAVVRGLAQRLADLDPAGGSDYEKNRKAFEERLDERWARWKKTMAPLAGAPFVSYHKNLSYFAQRFGLICVGEMEPKPGLPPTASHTEEIRRVVRERGVRLLLTQPYFERKSLDALAKETGARVVVVPLAPLREDYLTLMDNNVAAVAAAFQGIAP